MNRRSSMPGSSTRRSASSSRAGAPRSRRPSTALDLPMPPPARDPERGAARSRGRVPLVVGRVHVGPPRRSGSDLVSEAGIHVGVARARAGAAAGGGRRRGHDRAARRSHRPGGPRRGHGSGAADALRGRSRDRPSRGGRAGRRPDPRRDPADLHRLPGARAHQDLDRRASGRLRTTGRSQRDLRDPLDLRADQPTPDAPPSSRPGSRHPVRTRPSQAAGSSTSSRASRARTADPAGPTSRTSSARPSAGPSATARTAASRSKPSSRSDRGRARRRARRGRHRRRRDDGRGDRPARHRGGLRGLAPRRRRGRDRARARAHPDRSRTSSRAARPRPGIRRRRGSRVGSPGCTTARRSPILPLPSPDLVVEAALEDLEAKRSIFRELDGLVAPTTIIATNTSALSVACDRRGGIHPGPRARPAFLQPGAGHASRRGGRGAVDGPGRRRTRD